MAKRDTNDGNRGDSTPPPAAADDVARLLRQVWVHSHEEDSPGEEVYRPADYKQFPPSRGRRSLDLSDGGIAGGGGTGGVMRAMAPGPSDRPTASAGNWRLDEANQRVVLRHPGAHPPERALRIKSITKDRLVIETPKA